MSLFIDHAGAREIEQALDRVRVAVRRARRFTTKSESRVGQDANRSLHEAEKELDALIRRLAGT